MSSQPGNHGCLWCYHEAIVSEFRIGPLHPLSREELLSPEAPPGMTSAYRHLEDARALTYRNFEGKEGVS